MTLRSNHCAAGHLDCIKEATMLGDKYFVEPGSVARHLAQIEELISLDTRSSGRVGSNWAIGPRRTTTPCVGRPRRVAG